MVLLPPLAYILGWKLRFLGGYVLLIFNAVFEIFFVVIGIKISRLTSNIVVWCAENLRPPYNLL